MCAAADIVLEGEGDRHASVSVALNSGISQRYESLHELRAALEKLEPDDIATLRVDAEIPDTGNVMILVRRQKPGVVVAVAGRDQANVLGLAQLVHGRLMTGYEVLGSPRGILARAKSKGALFVDPPDALDDLGADPHRDKALAKPRTSNLAHASMADPVSIFISYSHADLELARALYEGLKARGHQVWIDQQELRIGDSLIERISTTIADIDFFLALVSPAAAQSRWCQKELALAVSGELARKGMRVMPLRVDGAEMPAALSDQLYLEVSLAGVG